MEHKYVGARVEQYISGRKRIVEDYIKVLTWNTGTGTVGITEMKMSVERGASEWIQQSSLEHIKFEIQGKMLIR